MLLFHQKGALRTHKEPKSLWRKTGHADMKAWSIESLFYTFHIQQERKQRSVKKRRAMMDGLTSETCFGVSFFIARRKQADGGWGAVYSFSVVSLGMCEHYSGRLSSCLEVFIHHLTHLFFLVAKQHNTTTIWTLSVVAALLFCCCCHLCLRFTHPPCPSIHPSIHPMHSHFVARQTSC